MDLSVQELFSDLAETLRHLSSYSELFGNDLSDLNLLELRKWIVKTAESDLRFVGSNVIRRHFYQICANIYASEPHPLFEECIFREIGVLHVFIGSCIDEDPWAYNKNALSIITRDLFLALLAFCYNTLGDASFLIPKVLTELIDLRDSSHSATNNSTAEPGISTNPVNAEVCEELTPKLENVDSDGRNISIPHVVGGGEPKHFGANMEGAPKPVLATKEFGAAVALSDSSTTTPQTDAADKSPTLSETALEVVECNAVPNHAGGLCDSRDIEENGEDTKLEFQRSVTMCVAEPWAAAVAPSNLPVSEMVTSDNKLDLSQTNESGKAVSPDKLSDIGDDSVKYEKCGSVYLNGNCEASSEIGLAGGSVSAVEAVAAAAAAKPRPSTCPRPTQPPLPPEDEMHPATTSAAIQHPSPSPLLKQQKQVIEQGAQNVEPQQSSGQSVGVLMVLTAAAAVVAVYPVCGEPEAKDLPRPPSPSHGRGGNGESKPQRHQLGMTDKQPVHLKQEGNSEKLIGVSYSPGDVGDIVYSASWGQVTACNDMVSSGHALHNVFESGVLDISLKEEPPDCVMYVARTPVPGPKATKSVAVMDIVPSVMDRDDPMEPSGIGDKRIWFNAALGCVHMIVAAIAPWAFSNLMLEETWRNRLKMK